MSETVRFEVEGGQADGYLSGSHGPGVIVIQEWWGLVPHVRSIADRVAAEGYRALAPDLYHGKSTFEVEEAEHLMDGLDWARAGREIKAAADHLRGVGCARVGVVGFCMGGALSCLAAATAGVDAAVSFYGFPPPPNPMDTSCPPTKIFFGEHEDIFSVDEARAWVESQQARGIDDTELRIYPGAGHAFFNDDRPGVYQADAASDAWTRTLGHFKKHLR